MKLTKAFFTCTLASVMIFSGCSAQGTDNTTVDKPHEGIVYYMEPSGANGEMEDLIKRYNKYCMRELDDSYKIEIVNFESHDELFTRLAAEIMSGGGPDFFTLDQELPFEKMAESGCFYDIEELFNEYGNPDDTTLSDCNQNILNGLKTHGALYFLPLFYGVDILQTDTGTMEQFGITLDCGETITYNKLEPTFRKFLNDQQGYAFLWGDGDNYFGGTDMLFAKLICDHVDFQNGETHFNDPSFTEHLDIMGEILNSRQHLGRDNGLEKYLFDTWYWSQNISARAMMSSGDNYSVFYPGITLSENDVRAFVQLGVAVNNNSVHKDELCVFLTYCLSEERQMTFCGDNEYSASGGWGNISFPVNQRAFDHAVENIEKNGYGLDNNEYMQKYIDTIRRANIVDKYIYPTDSYYYQKVIGETVNDYLDGTITREKFIYRLTAETEIYLNE